MEWLILLLLVPAILVPIVLLCGFAGCSFDPPGPPSRPTVTAAAKSAHHITVSWQPTDPDPVLRFRFVRKKGTETETDYEVDPSTLAVEDTGLEGGTDYTYEVTTIIEEGTSDPGTASIRTPTPAFEVDPMAVANNQTFAIGDYCIVQRIPASQLRAGGSKVKITMRSAPTGNVTINSLYISRVAGSGNLWDSATDLTPVISSPLTPPDDQPQNFYQLYSLEQTQDLIIAFDFTASSGAFVIRYVPAPGVTSYSKAGVQQAWVPARDSDYLTLPDRVYLVVAIEVP